MITQSLDLLEDEGLLLSAAEQSCFFCGMGLLDPAICWSGKQGEAVYFHHACLAERVPALLDEALEGI
jgi:hypothetical protein